MRRFSVFAAVMAGQLTAVEALWNSDLKGVSQDEVSTLIRVANYEQEQQSSSSSKAANYQRGFMAKRSSGAASGAHVLDGSPLPMISATNPDDLATSFVGMHPAVRG